VQDLKKHKSRDESRLGRLDSPRHTYSRNPNVNIV
jgi:hypothetical protein